MLQKIMKIIVNLITTARLICAIILICLFNFIIEKNFLICVIILFLTDWIDGFLARKFHVETLFGSLMDTFADKTLNIILILPLIKKVPLIIGILIFEVGIMLINTLGSLEGKKVNTNYYGKIKMWFVAISIILGYFQYFNWYEVRFLNIIIILTMIMQVLTMISYIVYFKNQPTIRKKGKKSDKNIFQKLFDTKYYIEEKESIKSDKSSKKEERIKI